MDSVTEPHFFSVVAWCIVILKNLMVIRKQETCDGQHFLVRYINALLPFVIPESSSGLPIPLAAKKPGMWKRKRSFFCGSGSAKNLSLPLSHRLFDLKSNLAQKFCRFPW